MGVGGLKQARGACYLDGAHVRNAESHAACRAKNRLIHLFSASRCLPSWVVFEPELPLVDDLWRSRTARLLEGWDVFVRGVP